MTSRAKTMVDKYVGGAILSPPDPRDYTVGSALEVAGDTLPQAWETWQPPVEKQGQIGNCVAQSLANIMECIDHHSEQEHRDWSVGYIYGKSSVAAYSGMIPRDACDVLVKEGDVLRSVWECLEENPACWEKRFFVSEDIKAQAQRVKMYVRLYTEDEAKRFMLKYNLPVMVCVDVQKVYGPMFGDGKHALIWFGWDDSKRKFYKYNHKYVGDNLHLQDSQGTGGMWGDGTRWANFDDFEEVWGIVPNEKITFPDVEDSRWSAASIREAVEDGIFVGFEDGTFRPEEPLTREQAAAFYKRLKTAFGK